MPSIFRPNSCKFIWNANIARVEISIDGSTSLDPDSRATLLVYYPLTFYLGLTKLQQKGASRCFGAPYGKVTSASIVQTSHATAGYPPRLPRPEFIFWFLNVLEQQVWLVFWFKKMTRCVNRVFGGFQHWYISFNSKRERRLPTSLQCWREVPYHRETSWLNIISILANIEKFLRLWLLFVNCVFVLLMKGEIHLKHIAQCAYACIFFLSNHD